MRLFSYEFCGKTRMRCYHNRFGSFTKAEIGENESGFQVKYAYGTLENIVEVWYNEFRKKSIYKDLNEFVEECLCLI